MVEAWRGSRIDAAVDGFLDDLYGTEARELVLDDGTRLASGGAAQVVAYLGHNRWMDRPGFDWAALEERAGLSTEVKGWLAIACHTYYYLQPHLPAPQRTPLLLTADYLFPGGHAFEAAVRSFLEGGSYAAIREAAATGYALGQGRPIGQVRQAFINPGDRRWASGHAPVP